LADSKDEDSNAKKSKSSDHNKDGAEQGARSDGAHLKESSLEESKRQAAKSPKRAYQDTEKPFLDHFDELRVRILRMLWAGLAASCLAYFARDPIMLFLKAPLMEVLPPGRQNLVFTGVFESFMNSLKVSGIAGFFLALPFILYQVWCFVAPGLKENERKLAIPFVFASSVFFIGGAAFAYYMVFPHGFKFMIEFGQPNDVPMITIKEYYGLIFRLFLLFGVAFQFPVALVFFALIGVVDAEYLRKHRRTAIIAIAVVCAVCAPPDPLSMIFMMIPLYVFYEGAILIIGKFIKKRPPR